MKYLLRSLIFLVVPIIFLFVVSHLKTANAQTATNLQVSAQTCSGGRVITIFSWTPALQQGFLVREFQWLDLSTQNNNFPVGSYIGTSNPPNKDAGTYTTGQAGGQIGALDPGTTHYWRINTHYLNENWHPSETKSFTTINCSGGSTGGGAGCRYDQGSINVNGVLTITSSGGLAGQVNMVNYYGPTAGPVMNLGNLPSNGSITPAIPNVQPGTYVIRAGAYAVTCLNPTGGNTIDIISDACDEDGDGIVNLAEANNCLRDVCDEDGDGITNLAEINNCYVEDPPIDVGEPPPAFNISDPGVFTPSKNFQTFGRLASDIVIILVSIAGGLLLFFVVLAGFKFATSSGDPKKIASANATLTYAIIGIAVVILAFVIVRILQFFLQSNVPVV